MDNIKYNEVIKALTRMSEEDPDGFSSEILALINSMQRKIETLNAGIQHISGDLKSPEEK